MICGTNARLPFPYCRHKADSEFSFSKLPSFYTRTPYDKEWDDARLTLYLRSGYVYDGVQLTYNTCRNWASGKMYLTSYTEDSRDATSRSMS